MATKNNPGKFDCYENARPDEPMFVLLGRDESAPDAVYAWIAYRISIGKNRPGDAQLIEAAECARDMVQYRESFQK